MATPLGKKKPLSAAMADDIVDASKIDPEDIIDAEYDDIPRSAASNSRLSSRRSKKRP